MLDRWPRGYLLAFDFAFFRLLLIGTEITLKRSPARVAQLVERSPSKATDLGSIPGWGHGPAVGSET